MNKLTIDRQGQVVKALCEGNSLRATSRMTGVAVNTVVKLLIDLGTACAEYQDKTLRNLTTKTIEVDEIWSFCYAKEANIPAGHENEFGYGDVWTFIGLDATTKLVASWFVGMREPEDAEIFLRELRGRLTNRVQLTTDGHKMYYLAVDGAFGDEIDYAMLVKYYGNKSEEKHVGSVCTSAKPKRIKGSPDMTKVSTSYVERQNLTVRMGMRRFTRLTNAFSKKLENHIHALALHFMWYNFARPHSSLKNPYARTPAMAAGVTDHIWTADEILRLLMS